MMNEAGNKDGTFLIRNSSKKIKFFVLSMIWKNKGKGQDEERGFSERFENPQFNFNC